jgi:hypothetical protein
MLIWEPRSHCELGRSIWRRVLSMHMRLPRDAQRIFACQRATDCGGMQLETAILPEFVSGANKDQRSITPSSLACA